MIFIQKGKEPDSLTAYKRQPYASYDGYAEKDELREALLRDQGYICAYCMRRIENDRNSMKIEHWKAQSQLETEEEKLDFKIMLGVCDGCRGSTDKFTTCDEHRHNAELVVNPLNQSMMASIRYDRNGYIKSTDARVDKDLNRVLNLNCEQALSRIVMNRKNIYRECQKQLMKIQEKGIWKKSTLEKVMRQYYRKKDGRNPEYVGVPLYLIDKYRKRCRE